MGSFKAENAPAVSCNCKTQRALPLVTRLPDEAPRADWQERYDVELHAAYRLVAQHVYRAGRLGEFGYKAFDHINTAYFEGKLPETLILWDLTAYGRCLGWCRSAADGPPIIKLHPSIVEPAARPPTLPRHLQKVWNVLIPWLGWAFAFDILLHECIHAAVNYLHGGYERLPGVRSYWTSHNNPLWVGELNRIAPLLGYYGDPFTMRLPKRVPGEVSPDGKPATRSVRAQDGNAPAIERFPYGVPARSALYLAKKLPFAWGQA
jgi:hypothetical protein